MNVVYSSSDLFSEIAGTSLVSLFENNKEEDEINIYYIDNGITEQNKKNLYSIVEKYGRKLQFVNSVDIEKLAKTKITNRLRKSCPLTRPTRFSVLARLSKPAMELCSFILKRKD